MFPLSTMTGRCPVTDMLARCGTFYLIQPGRPDACDAEHDLNACAATRCM